MKNDIQIGLEQEASIIAERMPITMDDIIRTEQRLDAYIKKTGVSQAEVARSLGVSDGQVSSFLKNKYKGDVPHLCRKVVSYLNTMERRDRRNEGKPDYVQTVVADRIRMLIEQTSSLSNGDEGKIGIIIGDGGHGKTWCLRAYAQVHPNTIYVQLDDCMHIGTIFSEIARELHIESSGTVESISRRLIGALHNREAIVILDEASSLNASKLNKLRQIITVKSCCPLILAGNTGLLQTVRQPTTRLGYESLDQFTSRIVAVLNLDEEAQDRGDDGGVYTTDSILAMYQYGGLRLTTDAVDTLKRICNSPRSGRLRSCVTIITAIHTAQKVRDRGYIDSKDIQNTISTLKLFAKENMPLYYGPKEVEIKNPEVAAQTA